MNSCKIVSINIINILAISNYLFNKFEKSIINDMKVLCVNKQAKFHYEVKEVLEAGLVLKGCEVKSIKAGVSLTDTYGKISSSSQEVELCNFFIPKYKYTHNIFQYDESRAKKLLLKKNEIKRLIGKILKQKLFVIPLKLFINNRGWIKVELGLCMSKNARDKKANIKRRDLDREMCRDLLN